jgi:hypothetical protein
MANRSTPKYTAQMIFMVEPRTAGEIRAWAQKTGVAYSELIRESVDGYGWARRRRQLEEEYGRLKPSELHAGVLSALPREQREAYAKKHGLPFETAQAAA